VQQCVFDVDDLAESMTDPLLDSPVEVLYTVYARVHPVIEGITRLDDLVPHPAYHASPGIRETLIEKKGERAVSKRGGGCELLI
jgi:hypothetical protein